MEEVKEAFMHVGFFFLAYIPVVLLLAPMRAWPPLFMAGAAASLLVFLVSYYMEKEGRND